jgi:hypothetical protein
MTLIQPQFFKLIISKAENTRLTRDLIEMMQLPVPGSGVACTFGATDDLKVVRLQAIVTLEKNTSGWLHANPAHVEIMGQQGPGSVEVAMWYLFIIPIYDFGMDGREKEWKRE